MPQEPTSVSARQERLQEILLSYVEAVQSGSTPNQEAFLAEHREFAAELAEFLAGYEKVDRLATPIREARDEARAAQMGTGLPRAASLSAARRASQVAATGEATEAAGAAGPAATGELGTLGDYRLLREVGRGGMGIVYEAEQISLHRRVAVKILPFAAGIDARQLQRFRNEAEAAAHLHHSHIVPVFAVGSVRGVHYYAMQLIEGQSLATLISSLQGDGRGEALEPAAQVKVETKSPAGSGAAARTADIFSTEHSTRSRRYYRKVAEIGKQAAEALEYGHQMGVVHRDIKPANLLLDGRGQLWITDFGLAQIQSNVGVTLTGELLGTLRYVSPEQAMAKRGLVDHRTDIYSLGATLYELLTLKPVFDERDRHALLHRIGFDEPVSPRRIEPTIPVELETIVLRALTKNPSERYGTMQEVADDLQRFLDDKPIQAKRPTLIERARKWMRRHPSAVAAALLLLLFGVIGFGVSTAMIAHEQAETHKAFKLEKQRAEEAEQRFLLARRSADEMIRIAEEDLADNPAVHNSRRRLLEVALSYYQEFIDLRRDDPTAQEELALTRDRVKKILADLTVMQGAGKIFLLNNPAVLANLGLDEKQRELVKDLVQSCEGKQHELFSEFRRQSPEERQKRFVELARSNDAAMAMILSPGQIVRLQQIAWQWEGPKAFFQPEIATLLKLTTEQKREIRALEANFFFEKGPGGPGGPPRKGPHDKGPDGKGFEPKRFEDWRRTMMTQILAKLTDEQKKVWQQQVGEPFAFEGPNFMPFPPPPGDFGPPPRPDGSKQRQYGK